MFQCGEIHHYGPKFEARKTTVTGQELGRLLGTVKRCQSKFAGGMSNCEILYELEILKY